METKKFEKHVFICTNQKENGKKCCGNVHGLTLVQELKSMIKEKGLQSKIRINKAGCLDACAYGPAAVVYPEQKWYGDLTIEDMTSLFNNLTKNVEFSEKQIDFEKPAFLQFKKEN